MGIILLLLGTLGCVLAALAMRIGLHELCYRFDGSRPGATSIDRYWLTFKASRDVTYEQGKEAFHDGAANFPTLELATQGATRVNADRKARGQPLYTVVHSSGGMEWPLGGQENEGVGSQQHAGGIHEPKGKAAS